MPGNDLQFSDLAKVFPTPEGKPKPMQMASSGGHKQRILIGDDDPVYTLTLFQCLVEAGYEVVVTEVGTDAIAELRKADHPVVAILDWKMPGMDGLEICERMRDADKNIYLIVSSEEPATSEIVAGLERGADLYLAKSVPLEEVLAYVKVGLRTVDRQRAPGHQRGELGGSRLTPED
jgi:DNA-binding response OmpR family regulator